MASRFRDVQHFCFQRDRNPSFACLVSSAYTRADVAFYILTFLPFWWNICMNGVGRLKIVSFPSRRLFDLCTYGTNTFGIGFQVFFLLSANVTLCCTYLHAAGFCCSPIACSVERAWPNTLLIVRQLKSYKLIGLVCFANWLVRAPLAGSSLLVFGGKLREGCFNLCGSWFMNGRPKLGCLRKLAILFRKNSWAIRLWFSIIVNEINNNDLTLSKDFVVLWMSLNLIQY